MKIILLLVAFITIGAKAFAQDYPEYGLDKVRIVEKNKTVVAEIYPVNTNLKPKAELFYCWYGANLIHTTQGGYSGRLLNGQYNEFYLNKNLMEQGTFKKGLKDGDWKSWNEDGSLKSLIHWKSGIITCQQQKISFWKKVNIFKRKQPLQTDTVYKKPVKP